MKSICPHCEAERIVERIAANEKVNVRGEEFEVSSTHLKCTKCENEFDDPERESDSLAVAYEKYRERHNLMRPEQITRTREQFGVTQAEFAALTGLGVATLSRYENGALRSEAHERVLHLISAPHIFCELVREARSEVISPKRRIEILAKFSNMDFVWLNTYVFDHIAQYEVSEFTGEASFNVDKFKAVCLYFAKGGVWKTKLNKLLFYSDFLCYGKKQRPITGCRYAAADYGPVPDNFQLLYSLFVSSNLLRLEERSFENGSVGDMFYAVEAFQKDLFDKTELDILTRVQDAFHNFTSKQITEWSHREEAYTATMIGKLISYRHANGLRLPAESGVL